MTDENTQSPETTKGELTAEEKLDLLAKKFAFVAQQVDFLVQAYPLLKAAIEQLQTTKQDKAGGVIIPNTEVLTK